MQTLYRPVAHGENGSLRLSQSLTTYDLSKWQLVLEDRK